MSEWKTGKPKKDGNYLIQASTGTMSTLEWADGWNCRREEDGTVIRENQIEDDYVVAWQPLPEPYVELKRCPFCGAKAKMDPRWPWVVYCENCGSRTSGFDNRDLAIAAWNLRIYDLVEDATKCHLLM